ncbi:MAG: PIN domain-containing protein [Anaerolineae bacterium]|nr:PIN domain-containing protein [Anaerolineae bacterium]
MQKTSHLTNCLMGWMRNVNAITRTAMPIPEIFLDSSVLMAGIISSQGASRVLLLLSEDQKIRITISEQVIIEVERNIARKIPKILSYAREIILQSQIIIVRDPSKIDVLQHQDWISHPADVPILVAATIAKTEFLVTLNTKHFLDDPQVALRAGLQIGTPGDALKWLRERFQEDI